MRRQALLAGGLVALFVLAGLASAGGAGATTSLGLPPGAAERLAAGEAVLLVLPDGAALLRATPRHLLAQDAVLAHVGGDGVLTAAPRAPLTTYIGAIEGRDDLQVRLTLRDGAAEGLVLDPAGGGWILVARDDGGADVLAIVEEEHEAMGEDGVEPPASTLGAAGVAPATPDASAGTASGTLRLRLALETDHNSWRNNQETWQQNALELANYVEAIYWTQLDVEFEVTYLGAWTERDPYTATDLCPTSLVYKLDQFARYWQTHRAGVERDTAHLLLGRSSYSGNIIGCAYISQLATDWAYGTNRMLTSLGRMGADAYDNANVFAHELGHNFGGLHERSLGTYGLAYQSIGPPYTIMNPTAVRGLLRFSELDGVHSPVTGNEIDNEGAMREYAETRLSAA